MNKSIFILCLLFSFQNSLFSQELKIKRDGNVKTFNSGSLYYMVLSKNKNYKKDSCCDNTELTGKINSIEADSLGMNLFSINKTTVINDRKLEQNDISWQANFEKKIATKDILYFKNYKSFTEKNNKRRLNIIGGLLLMSTGVTLVNSFFVKDKVSRNNLYKLGALQIGFGMTLSIISSKKRHYLSGLKIMDYCKLKSFSYRNSNPRKRSSAIIPC